MSRSNKRKHQDFDPTKSDSDDEDYDNAAPSSARSRTKHKHISSRSGRPASKRRKDTYGGYDDDIEDDEEFQSSEEEASFSEDSEAPRPKINPNTGRATRRAAQAAVNYEESEEDEIPGTDDDDDDNGNDTSPPTKTSQPRQSLIVRLPVSLDMSSNRPKRISSKRGSTPDLQAFGARRSSRISHNSDEPLQQLTDSGRRGQITRGGSRQSSEEPVKRHSLGGKSLKNFPSAIMEASQESSGPASQGQADGPASFIGQLQEHAAAEDVDMAGDVAGSDDVKPAEAEADDGEGDVGDDAQNEQEDDDEEEEAIRRPSRSSKGRDKSQASPLPQRTLRARKPRLEQSSDFEPDAEGPEVEDEDDDSDEDKRGSKRKAVTSDDSDGSPIKRASTRNQRKRPSQRDSASASGGSDLDPEEIADEAAELDEDRRRNRRSGRNQRSRRGRRVEELAYERTLRDRSKTMTDYRILRPENNEVFEEDDAAPAPSASQGRGKNARGGYRPLFSTLGPFGGALGGPAVFGGPSSAGLATGGVDSDSSDDDAIRRPSHALGGGVGMTPTQPSGAFGLFPQTHNADPAQAGGAGAPANFGKIQDKKALADADPLGVDPNVNFDGVGGLQDHIDRLQEMVALPLLYPEIFTRIKITPPRGVLFHGPPGTGKTLLARALASSLSSHGKKVTFYMRKGADALSKWVGEAERQLRMLFEEARKTQPSIIFFDEIDGLAPVRSSKQEQIHASIVATLLALMDGMDGRGQVIVIGATNRPDSVDPALRRPGRFDREFYFPLPNKEARRAIIDIHTKGWEPELKPQFKEQLADLTKGYGGADLRALCTEAALNAVQGTYPQIYASKKKLIIDTKEIKVLAKDFMISVNKMVPSSERSATSGSAPLKKELEPLLRKPFCEIEEIVKSIVPRTKKRTALEEAQYDDRDDEFGFEKENLMREFEASRVFRPRLIVCGLPGMGQQYIGAALLNKFEGMYVANFDLPNIYKDSTRSSEAAIIQMFEEVKRHKPSVIYIPHVNVWYESLPDSVIRTFTGLLRSLPPTDPVLLLGIMEANSHGSHNEGSDKAMMRDLFGYSSKNAYILSRPDSESRESYFAPILDYITRSPAQFPDPDNRKKRDIPDLPEAPVVVEAPKELSKKEQKKQQKQDRITINMLKQHIQPVMDQIKRTYRKFRNPIIEPHLFEYLLDEDDPDFLTTDLPDEQAQQQLDRPYRTDQDKNGVMGLREVATNKFFYNLDISIIEQRLANGYYMRPSDFRDDIKRLKKDAVAKGVDQERIIKSSELLSNVEVDMDAIEKANPALVAACEGVYQRDKARKAANGKPSSDGRTSRPEEGAESPRGLAIARQGSDLEPAGQSQMPSLTPAKSGLSNGTHVSQGHDADVEMGGTDDVESHPRADTQPFSVNTPAAGADRSQGVFVTPGPIQRSQHSSIMQIAPGSQARDYHNSASTTTSGNKTESRSDPSTRHSGHTESTRGSNGHELSTLPGHDGQDLPSTQEPFGASQLTPHSSPDLFQTAPSRQTMGPPALPASQTLTTGLNQQQNSPPSARRSSDIEALLNPPADSAQDRLRPSTLIAPDESTLKTLSFELVSRSSGLSVEQLEQVMASLMRAVWDNRTEWNRNIVAHAVKGSFNEVIADLESVQRIQRPSQQERDGAGAEADGFGFLRFRDG